MESCALAQRQHSVLKRVNVASFRRVLKRAPKRVRGLIRVYPPPHVGSLTPHAEPRRRAQIRSDSEQVALVAPAGNRLEAFKGKSARRRPNVHLIARPEGSIQEVLAGGARRTRRRRGRADWSSFRCDEKTASTVLRNSEVSRLQDLRANGVPLTLQCMNKSGGNRGPDERRHVLDHDDLRFAGGRPARNSKAEKVPFILGILSAQCGEALARRTCNEHVCLHSVRH